MSFRKVDSDIKDNNFEKEEKDNNQIMYDEFETNFGENQEEDFFERGNLSQPKPQKSLSLDRIENYHNLQFSLLYLVSFFITCISCVYYYSYNDFNNKKLLDVKEYLNTDFPFYKIMSKYTKGRSIYINLQSNTTNYNEELLSTRVQIIFIFSSDIVHLKIFSNFSDININEEFYDMSDPELTSTNIDNYKESNIGIKFYDFPFGFKLYRKDDGNILFDSRCDKNQNLLFFSPNYKQICTIINQDNYHFGFEENGNKKNSYIELNNQKFMFFSNKTNSFPFFLSYNPKNQTSYGIYLMNSGPLLINVNKNQMSYEMINGYINFYVFSGPNTKEVILQMQKTIGIPILPKFNVIDWNYFSNKNKRVEENNIINFTKLNNIDNIITFQYDISNLSLYSNNESNLSIFLNPTYIAKELEDLSFINYLFIHKSNLLIKNKLLLKYLNILGISESKYYYHYLKEKRPLIISTKSTVCSGTYSIKYLNNISYSYEGMLEVIKQNKKENLFGNPYILSEFNKKSYEINKDNEELKIRWSQLLSILPLVSPGDLEIPLYYKNFRYIFGIYLYTYYIVIASEGGSFIRPLYFDLKTLNYTQQLLFNENQIMFGSNIMLIPITEKNKLNISCYFPRERFYDFYSGELINRDGEGFYNIIYKDYYKMPIFLRGGKITPFQLMDISNEELSQKEFSTKLLINQSIQIIISLDSNFQASGRIYLDNFYNTDARNKKIFYKMLISVSQRTTDVSIFFKVYSFKYKIPQNLFNNSINKITIYGFSKIGVKKLTIMNKNGRIVLDKNSYSFSQTNDILIIKDISIPLDMDTKILIL